MRGLIIALLVICGFVALQGATTAIQAIEARNEKVLGEIK